MSPVCHYPFLSKDCEVKSDSRARVGAELRAPRFSLSQLKVSETVKAANALPDFTGDNGRTAQLLEGKFSINMTTELATPTALSDLFAGLTEENFYQAMDAARTFSGEAPRAMVMISVARAVLDEKRSNSAKAAVQ